MKYLIKLNHFWIEVIVQNGSGQISSNLKQGCEEPPETCLGCAAIDGLESLILAHACQGIDVSSAAYRDGIETALDAIGNND